MQNHPDHCIIWRIKDGKPGHERQTEGLAKALTEQLPATVVDIPAESFPISAWHWLTGSFPPGRNLPAPDLIMGAGHHTHLSMLAARRTFGGKVVVLMKPSLPLRWFDLCLIPQHDKVGDASNILKTQGAINAMQAGDITAKDAAAGLILIGGVSSHFDWDDEQITRQLEQLLDKTPQMRWTLTTSPRTPAHILAKLEALGHHVDMVPYAKTTHDWLPQQLQHASQVWVTPDSVSMVYEALTAGAAVGLFDLQASPRSRVANGVKSLIQDNRATCHQDWLAGKPLPPPSTEFNEAARAARWIKNQWLPDL